MVLAIRERTTKRNVGRVRYFHVKDGKRATLQPIIDKHVDPWADRIIIQRSTTLR